MDGRGTKLSCSMWTCQVSRRGEGNPLGCEMISVDSAVRRTPSHLGHATEPDMRNLLQAANAPQAVMDPSSRFSCSQCDAMTATRIPRGGDPTNSRSSEISGNGRQVVARLRSYEVSQHCRGGQQRTSY